MVVCEDVIDAVIKCEMFNQKKLATDQCLTKQTNKKHLTSKHIGIKTNKLCDDVRNSLLLYES